jgi:hypothetical protein
VGTQRAAKIAHTPGRVLKGGKNSGGGGNGTGGRIREDQPEGGEEPAGSRSVIRLITWNVARRVMLGGSPGSLSRPQRWADANQT